MNPIPPTTKPHRRIWRWVLIGTGICLAPFVVLAMVAVSYLTLDHDVSVLRGHVMGATDSHWSTKVQLSVGRVTLGAVQLGLCFVHKKDIEDARLALGAIDHASVGVYERSSDQVNWSREQLFTKTDHAMQERGWTRLVGVVDEKDTVLIYVPRDMKEDGPVDLCLAVVSAKELVVVSTSVDPVTLEQLVARHVGKDTNGHLNLAQLKF